MFFFSQDEKIQHVLGHFQKDFEGGVSAENLGKELVVAVLVAFVHSISVILSGKNFLTGSKYGGYGSFLPTYQRSPPPLPQSRSPPKVANVGTSRSPYQQSAEVLY